MLNDIEITINDESNKPHIMSIHHTSDFREAEQLGVFEYRYNILKDHDYHYLGHIDDARDIDEFDDHCFHIIVKFDGHIVGYGRLIYGDIVPLRDFNFSGDRKIFANQRIFEISRLISAPKRVTNVLPKHFVLFAMFYYGTLLTKENGFTMAIGATKDHVLKKLFKLHYPVKILEGSGFSLDIANYEGPLKPYFADSSIHKIHCTYTHIDDALIYLKNMFSNPFVFNTIDKSHLELKNILYFNLYLLYRKFFKINYNI